MSEIEFAGVSANLCPFCGGNNLAWETVEHNQMLMWSVVCRGADCFAQGPIDLGKSGAISKWNVLDALLAENEQLKNHAVPFAVLTNENELLTADNDLLRKQLDDANGNIHILCDRLEKSLPRIHQSKTNDEFCREAHAVLDAIASHLKDSDG